MTLAAKALAVDQENNDINPYAAPLTNDDLGRALQDGVAGDLRGSERACKCPVCGADDSRPAAYDPVHGRRGPRAIQDMLCQNCGANFDGETGRQYPPRKNPIGCIILSVIVVVIYFALNFLLMLA